jgi:hypothetical protein
MLKKYKNFFEEGRKGREIAIDGVDKDSSILSFTISGKSIEYS